MKCLVQTNGVEWRLNTVLGIRKLACRKLIQEAGCALRFPTRTGRYFVPPSSSQQVATSVYWAWVPTVLGFWLVIALLLHNYPSVPRPRQRFRRPSGSPFWSVLAVLAGLLSLHGFLGNWTLLADAQLIVAWLAFALINPWFEESYWRGLLIDSTASWGKLASLLYSSVWFAASHPLIWGIHSLPLRKPEAVARSLLGSSGAWRINALVVCAGVWSGIC